MKTLTIQNKSVPLFLAILRIGIGWHFLYEGLSKLVNPEWSARSFLENSRWIFGDLYRWMVSDDTGMWILDTANTYGLILIGIGLILGLFTRLASWGGVALLLLYYVAYPPFGGFSYGTPAEGSYLLINKIIIEILALILLNLTDSGQFFGLDSLRKNRKKVVQEIPSPIEKADIQDNYSRRKVVKGLIGLPILAGFSGAFLKNLSALGPDIVSGATVKLDYKEIKDLKGKLSDGKLGNMTVSRMIMGCNMMIGWTHARDLIYTNSLVRAYNTEKKIIQTLYLGEQAGINTLIMVPEAYKALNKYKDLYNSKIQTI